uniref:uncharacterized protein LOC117610932 n=1 Tax=Osmia lignaria TaxID=473952 RepID=UPI00147822B2|nr:uncharacterized protein LOC117610932 [Osmia lignaria]
MDQDQAKVLSELMSTALETRHAVQNLIEPGKLDDCMLVHQMCRKMDCTTKERWESTLGVTTEYPSFEKLMEFITAKVRTLEHLAHDKARAAPVKRTPIKPSQPRVQQPAPSRPVHSAVASRPVQRLITLEKYNFERPSPFEQCDCCGLQHYIVECKAFRGMSPDKRVPCIDAQRLLLAKFPKLSQPTKLATKELGAAVKPPNHRKLLATAQALLTTPTSDHTIRILIDPGSEISFIFEGLTRLLNLRRHRSSITIIGVGGTKSTETKGVVNVTLQSKYSQQTVCIQAHMLTVVSTILPSFSLRAPDWPHIKNLRLADNDFLTPRPVDVIIGADFYRRIIKPNIIKGSPTAPIAQLSIFRWLVIGPVNESYTNTNYAHFAVAHNDQSNLQELLTKFWVQEKSPMDTPSTLTPEEEECEAHFCATHSRDNTGRYIVRIPLKAPASSGQFTQDCSPMSTKHTAMIRQGFNIQPALRRVHERI